jgi:hypothetical protein
MQARGVALIWRAGDGPTHCMENVGAADAGLFIENGGGDGGAALAEGAGTSGGGAAALEAAGAAEGAAEATTARLEAAGLGVGWFLGAVVGDEQAFTTPTMNKPEAGQKSARREREAMAEHGGTEWGAGARILTGFGSMV